MKIMKYADDPLKYRLTIVNKILKYATELMKYADDPLKSRQTIDNKRNFPRLSKFCLHFTCIFKPATPM